MITSLFTKTFFLCLALYACLISFSHAGTGTVWKNVSNGIRDTVLLDIAAHPDIPETVYISSRNAVYKTSDGGNSWDELFSYRGSGNGINTLALSAPPENIIFTGTDEGLYRSTDGGMHWEKIYSGIGTLESSVLSVAVDPLRPDTVYAGTQAGLYITDNGGVDWKRERGLPPESPVSDIVVDHADTAIIYAAAGDGIYKRLNRGSGWEKIFFSNYAELDILNEIQESEDFAGRIKTAVMSIFIDPADSKTVYAGTTEGLFISDDAGMQWSKAGSAGIMSDTVRDITVIPADPEHIYAATDRGVFRYSRQANRWEPLYSGLPSSDIRSIASGGFSGNEEASLWAATKRGVFKAVPVMLNAHAAPDTGMADEVLNAFTHEPSIDEIREAAIRYADVQPEKIDKWRKAAEKRAWLPSVRIAYSEGKDWQSSSYNYNYSGAKIYGDDDITRGKDDDWSVSLTWDFSDLVWSGDQTSIDNRSKLMVQLRDDILNEVTRLYFERRRLQYEGTLSPPGEVLERIEYELRLQELTANIDALTGSYLSKRLAREGEI